MVELVAQTISLCHPLRERTVRATEEIYAVYEN